MTCAEFVERVTAYLEAALDPGTNGRFLDHLGGCDGCTNYLQQLRATVELLERLDADAQPPPAQTGAATGPPDG